MRSSSRLFLFALVASSLLTPGLAAASSSYPGVVQQFTGAPSTPPCTLCHDSNAGGVGTANTPFGSAARARGLVAGSDDKLREVLEIFKQEAAAGAVDSDGDGVPDYDELVAGTDPNTGGGGEDGPVTAEYGCNNVSGQAPGAGSLLLIALAWLGTRRVRRR